MSMDSATGSHLLAALSQGSSPRQLESDQISLKSDDESSSTIGVSNKVKLMCSYGGKIMLRPHDSQLRYIGGDTRILVVPRSISFSDLCIRLSKLCGGRIVFPKYKLPYEDYDALVSVISDEDLDTMLEEYDRLGARDAPSRLRLFLFPRLINPKMPPSDTFDLAKNEQTFLEALNSTIQLQQQLQMNLIQQQQEIFFPTIPDQQEVIIVDGPGASACSSATSVVQRIIDSDAALQGDLPQILTSKNASPTDAAGEPRSNPRPASDIPPLQIQPQQPRIVPQQPLSIQQQPISAPPQPMPILSTQPMSMPILQQPMSMPILQQPISMPQQPISPPIQAPPPQILPPRGPKPRVSSPKSGDGIKEKKEKSSKLDISSSGSPQNKTGKPPAELEPSIIVEALENLKLADSNIEEHDVNQVVSTKPVLVSADVISPKPDLLSADNMFEASTAQMAQSSINVKEMSLNVFMEQQKIQEENALLAKIQKQQQVQVQPQQVFIQQPAFVQPQQPGFVRGFVQPGPYIIENNMVYYLADGSTTGNQQFIQRPVMNPAHFQHGGSGPLVARQQPPLQRQVSAAYPDQFQQQQIQLPMQQIQLPMQQQQQKVAYPTRMQSPSRFREPMTTLAMQPQPQFDQQQAGLARSQAYDIDPALVVVHQQLPYSAAP